MKLQGGMNGELAQVEEENEEHSQPGSAYDKNRPPQNNNSSPRIYFILMRKSLTKL